MPASRACPSSAGSRTRAWRFLLALLLCLTLAGCGGREFDQARDAFYQGRYEDAEALLTDSGGFGPDRVLMLMERGAVRQARGDFAGSAADFILADQLLERLETWSVSKGAGSLVVNDTVQDFTGVPFERTMLHDMAALDHLALGRWDRAAVEARRIIASLTPERRGDYPDDAFSRYLAGYVLQHSSDRANAAVQYRLAAALAPEAGINEDGSLDGSAASPGQGMLTCFFMIGRSPTGADLLRPDFRAPGPPEVWIRGTGGNATGARGRILADTLVLALDSEQRRQAGRAVKSVGRIIIKEGIAQVLEAQDEALGDLARLVLFGLLERPDLRRWETLPRWLGVARLPCPVPPEGYAVRVLYADGREWSFTVREPLAHRGEKTWFSFFRDLPGFAGLPAPPPGKGLSRPPAGVPALPGTGPRPYAPGTALPPPDPRPLPWSPSPSP